MVCVALPPPGLVFGAAWSLFPHRKLLSTHKQPLDLETLMWAAATSRLYLVIVALLISAPEILGYRSVAAVRKTATCTHIC